MFTRQVRFIICAIEVFMKGVMNQSHICVEIVIILVYLPKKRLKADHTDFPVP